MTWLASSFHLPSPQYGAALAGALNGVQIAALNEVYLLVAQQLTNWENHRTHRAYEDALTAKTFLFQFVNSYASLYWLVFFQVESGLGKCEYASKYGGCMVFVLVINSCFCSSSACWTWLTF